MSDTTIKLITVFYKKKKAFEGDLQSLQSGWLKNYLTIKGHGQSLSPLQLDNYDDIIKGVNALLTKAKIIDKIAKQLQSDPDLTDRQKKKVSELAEEINKNTKKIFEKVATQDFELKFKPATTPTGFDALSVLSTIVEGFGTMIVNARKKAKQKYEEAVKLEKNQRKEEKTKDTKFGADCKKYKKWLEGLKKTLQKKGVKVHIPSKLDEMAVAAYEAAEKIKAGKWDVDDTDSRFAKETIKRENEGRF